MLLDAERLPEVWESHLQAVLTQPDVPALPSQIHHSLSGAHHSGAGLGGDRERGGRGASCYRKNLVKRHVVCFKLISLGE